MNSNPITRAQESRIFEAGKLYSLADMIEAAYVKLLPLYNLIYNTDEIFGRYDKGEVGIIKQTIELAFKSAREFECRALAEVLLTGLGFAATLPEEEASLSLRGYIKNNGLALLTLYNYEFSDRFLFLSLEELDFFLLKERVALNAATMARYPTIHRDMQSAGRCIATQNFTAAVFHLGRATEIVMQDLAKRRGVSFYHKKRGKTAFKKAWGALLSDLQSQLDKGAIKSERVRTQYNSALITLRTLKGIRNDTDHPSNLESEIYEKEDALMIWQLTKSFIEHAARTFVKHS